MTFEACPSCHRWTPGGAPSCARCASWIEGDLQAAWHAALKELAIDAADEAAFAATVVDDPRGIPWRVVDVSLSRTPCSACASPLGAGPVGCGPCDAAHNLRWLGAEPDRPNVPPGNEHAIRVATAMVRVPHRFPAHLVRGTALFLPLFIAGDLGSIAERQAIARYFKEGGAPEPLTRCRSFSEMREVIAER